MSTLHSPRYKKLVKKLKLARIDAELTQLQAAEALGLSQTFISKCELGERRIDIFELLDFSKLYGKPLSYFLPANSLK